jgi:hypothetical protein
MSDPGELLIPLILDGLENGWGKEHEKARMLCESAPDLLAACRYALAKLDTLCRNRKTAPGIAEESLRAAIAKATSNPYAATRQNEVR